MEKAPNPSGWGLLVIVGFLVLVIWLGPNKPIPEISDDVQHGTIDCSQGLDQLTPTQIELCIDIQSFSEGSDYE